MPLSPQEQQELAELRRMDELERKYGSAPTAPSGMAEQAHQGVGRLMNTPGLKRTEDMMESQLSPERVGELASSSIVPGVASKIAGAFSSTAPRRIGTGAAVGGLQGLLRSPQGDETRLSNAGRGAAEGAAVATGGEAIGGLAGAAKWGLGKIGKSATRVSPQQAEVYASNPSMAEEMHDLAKNRPDELNERAVQQTRDALSKLQKTSTDPAMQELNARMSGPNASFRVKPEQYKGTAAGSEIERAHQVSPQGSMDLDVPVMEKHAVQASPVEARMSLSAPEEQFVPHSSGGFGKAGEAPAAQVSSVSRSIEKTGEPQTLEELLLPRGTQRVQAPTKVPDETSITGPQLLRAKRAASSAANVNQSKNPMGYRAGDDAEAQAAVNLRSAMRDNDPKLADLDQTIEKNLRLGHQLRSMPNASRIYSTGEDLASVPIRQTQQHLDQSTGSNFEQLAKALDAGKAANKPGSGIIDDLLIRPAGRKALQLSGKAASLQDALKRVYVPRTERKTK